MPKHNRDGLQTGLQSLRDHALIDEEPPRGEGEGIPAMWLADATVHKRRRGDAKREVLDLLAQCLWDFDRFKGPKLLSYGMFEGSRLSTLQSNRGHDYALGIHQRVFYRLGLGQYAAPS